MRQRSLRHFTGEVGFFRHEVSEGASETVRNNVGAAHVFQSHQHDGLRGMLAPGLAVEDVLRRRGMCSVDGLHVAQDFHRWLRQRNAVRT